VSKGTLGHPGDHVHGQLVHHVREGLRADEALPPGGSRHEVVLERGLHPGGHRDLKANTPFRFIAESGMRATEHHEGKLLEQIDLNTWVTDVDPARGGQRHEPPARTAWRSSRPSVPRRPFVGLFGTVWGIYHALTAIGIAGQASIDKVAGPVGEALIMTAFGLAVAVPAVLGYNWLVRRNKVALEHLRAFSADLHMVS
jgi:biopolymer transport protein ExbB